MIVSTETVSYLATECAGFDANFERDFPTKENRFQFYNNYVPAYNDSLSSSNDVDDLVLTSLVSSLIRGSLAENSETKIRLVQFFEGIDVRINFWT